MDMHDKLKQAGFNPPEKVKKIDSKQASMQLKINKAEEFLRLMSEYDNDINSAPDKRTFLYIQNSIVLYYERFCEAIKDILNKIAIKENITTLSDKRGLGELVRETIGILGVDSKVESAIKRLTTRNDAVHDYINSDYYDDMILTHVSNDINEYKSYLENIKAYLKNKGIISS